MNPLSVLRDSLYFFRRHLPNILQLCLPLVVLGALAWPVTVWAVTRLPRFRALGDRPPPAEDNGFEGLAVLMAILGPSGLLVSLMMLWMGAKFRADGTMWMSNIFLLGGMGLVARSGLHAWVGLRAVRGSAVSATDEFLRYGNVGVIVGGCVGGLFTLALFVGSYGGSIVIPSGGDKRLAVAR